MKKSRPIQPRSRRLFIESLEAREVLAGNVTATLSAGILRVTGDTLNNKIAIWQNTNTGLFSVTGQTSSGATKVNNGPNNNTVTFNGAVNSIIVDLKQGNDSVTIGAGTNSFVQLSPAILTGVVTVKGGTGGDTMNVLVAGAAAINIDGGLESGTVQNDIVNVAFTVAGSVAINTYGGNDFVSVNASIIPTLAIIAGVNTGGNDFDTVLLNRVASFTTAVQVGVAGVNPESGNTVQINESIFGTLGILGGANIDRVFLNRVFAVTAAINTFAGNDSVSLTDVKSGLTAEDFDALAELLGPLPFNLDQLIASQPGIPGTVAINTGEGSDFVTLTNVDVSANLAVLLAGGTDTLRTTNVTAKRAVLDGGLGTDGRTNGGITAQSLTVVNFEVFVL